MLRPATTRALLHNIRHHHQPRLQASLPRRFASTSSGTSRGTWRGAAVRWGLAAGAVYYYNTSPIFAEEPAYPTMPPEHQRHQLQHQHQTTDDKDDLPTLESLAAERASSRQIAIDGSAPIEVEASPDQLEEEAGQQSAFNPETGEINWDCPCLGGMAHGPCGEEFKAAFSCFVYSEEEPKGMDCIDKFKGMQDCFRAHPDVYGAELEDEDADELDEVPQVVGEEPIAASAKTDLAPAKTEPSPNAKEVTSTKTISKTEMERTDDTRATPAPPAPSAPFETQKQSNKQA